MIDPELASVLGAVAFAALLAIPAVASSARRRRGLRRMCAACGRVLVLGERTCDCGP